MLSIKTATFLATFIYGASALKITSPAENAVWNIAGSNSIVWTSVSTDPTSFNIVLANHDANCAPTGTSQVIKENVSAADGKFEVSGIAATKACGGYRINLVSPSNSGILAESAPFNLTGAADGTSPVANGTSVVGSAVNGTNTTTTASTNTTQAASNNTAGTLPALNNASTSGSTSKSNKFSPSPNTGAAPAQSSASSPSISLAASIATLLFAVLALVA